MKLTKYTINNKNVPDGTKIAIVSDLHGNSPSAAIKFLEVERPDYILAPGDIFEVMDGSDDRHNGAGFELLSACAQIAPTFFAPGNHDVGATGSWLILKRSFPKAESPISKENMERLSATGVFVLKDSYTVYDGMVFAGLGTGLVHDGCRPMVELLSEPEKHKGPKILLCHHPEYYPKYLKKSAFDLIVSGHAHGGQWRFFGRGFFAPGQGFFPKYTSGVYDNKLVVSRGLKKGDWIPRIFNPPEVVIVTVRN